MTILVNGLEDRGLIEVVKVDGLSAADMAKKSDWRRKQGADDSEGRAGHSVKSFYISKWTESPGSTTQIWGVYL
jgi:hypothetical protein